MTQNDDRHPSNRDRNGGRETADRLHPSLPVTAEVGGEGGSYADPTQQVASFENDLPRTRGIGGASSASTQAIRLDDLAGAGSGPDPRHGMLRYPTEAPDSPSASEEPRAAGRNWRAGAIGAAAGAIAVAGLELLRRHAR